MTCLRYRAMRVYALRRGLLCAAACTAPQPALHRDACMHLLARERRARWRRGSCAKIATLGSGSVAASCVAASTRTGHLSHDSFEHSDANMFIIVYFEYM